MKVFAIELKAFESIAKIKALQKLMDSTNAVGIHPDHPFAYVLFRTHDDLINGFKEYSKVFEYCKIVKNVAEIPDC